jgi:hypothetical protein
MQASQKISQRSVSNFDGDSDPFFLKNNVQKRRRRIPNVNLEAFFLDGFGGL